MRHNLLKPAALLLLGSLCSFSVSAQSGDHGDTKSQIITINKDETVVVKNDKRSGKTVIEIKMKDGTVYLNGNQLITVENADINAAPRKVIIGRENDSRPRVEAFSFGDRDDDGDFKDMPARPNSRRAMLGVLTDPKSEKVGAVVKDITPGSAAESAGLQSGDVITRVDGKAIKDAGALVTEIGAQHEPGDKVTINYERDGQEHTTTAKLQRAEPQVSTRSFRFSPDDMTGADMPNSLFRSFPFAAGDDAIPAPKLGVDAEDRADGEGVRVMGVKLGSPAAKAGLKEGDVITRVGNDKVGSVDELQMNLRSRKAGEKLMLEYQRGSQMMTADINLPKPVKRREL